MNHLRSLVDYFIYCPRCGSTKVIKSGRRPRKERDAAQRFECEVCGKRFTVGPFSWKHINEHKIEKIFSSAVEGKLYRKIAEEVGVAASTVSKTIGQYVPLVEEWELTLPLNIGWIWQGDEMYWPLASDWMTKRKFDNLGWLIPAEDPNDMWLINMIDEKTRYWLTVLTSPTRTALVIREVLERAVKVADHYPKIFKADEWKGYPPACRRVFPPSTKLSFKSKKECLSHINIIERLHGTIRQVIGDRKRFHGISAAQNFIQAFRFYYLFLRPHKGLGGKTPAEAAGIHLLYGRNWVSLFKTAYSVMISPKYGKDRHRKNS